MENAADTRSTQGAHTQQTSSTGAGLGRIGAESSICLLIENDIELATHTGQTCNVSSIAPSGQSASSPVQLQRSGSGCRVAAPPPFLPVQP